MRSDSGRGGAADEAWLDLEAEAWAQAEFDSPEEVEAVFRAQRRLSLLYGALFFLVTLTLPVLHSTWDYWTAVPLWGGFTLAYLAVTLLYPLFYVLLGVAYTIQANRLDEALLGRHRGVRPPPAGDPGSARRARPADPPAGGDREG